MWFGGVRVIIPDEENRILLVCQHHEGRDIWLPPGGSIDDGETSKEAATREVLEETGLTVNVEEMIWHVEELSHRGQRFAAYFLAKIEGGKLALGYDPELDTDHQILREVGFFTKEEINNLPHIYPTYIGDEIWDILERKRSNNGFNHTFYKMKGE